MFFAFLPLFFGVISEEEFETMFTDYRGRMLAIAGSVLREKQDAEDAVQNAFLSVYRQRARLCFSSDEQRKIYLCKCAKNAALNLLRAKKETLSLSEDLPDGPEAPDAAEIAGKNAACGELLCAVRALPAACRDAMTLYYLYEMKISDVAIALSLPVNTVKSHLLRGRKLLRRALAGKEGSR